MPINGQRFPRGADPLAVRSEATFAAGEGIAYDAASGFFVPADLVTQAELDNGAYVASPDEPGLRIVRGLLNTIAPSGVIGEGEGYSITTRHGTGDVTITFDTAFSDVPVVTTMFGDGSANAIVRTNTGGITASTARFQIRNLAGTAVDGPFHFIAIGPA